MRGWGTGAGAIAMVVLIGVAVAFGAPNVKYFTFSDVANETHFLHQGTLKFTEEATTLTMGKIHFNLVPGDAGASEEGLIEQVKEGKLDGAIVSVEAMSGVLPELRVFTLPYLFPDEEQAYRVLNGPTGADLLRSLKHKGIKGLAFVGMGWRQLVLREKKVETPADLTGLKIGVTAGAEGEFLSAIGAEPTSLSPADLAAAVESDGVDGLSISLQSLCSEGYHRRGQYVALTRHAFVPGVIIINPDKYGQLQQSEREALMSAARRAQDHFRKLLQLQAQEFKGLLEEDGVEVYEVNQGSFAESASSLYEKWGKEFGERTLEKIRNPE